MAEPVGVYRVRMAGAPPATPLLALRDKPSIAVLPFQNMSGDPAQDYFSDGIVEDIIHRPVALPEPGCHRAQFDLYLQRPHRRRDTDRARAVGGLRPRGSVRKGGDRLRITHG